MKNLINFKSLAGVEKTLIITSGQCARREYLDAWHALSVLFLPSYLIQRYDARENESLRSAIEKSQCTQLIFLGLLDEEMKYLLASHNRLHSLRAGLCFKTMLLPSDPERVMRTNLRTWALFEQHVETQCSQLMDIHFIADKVKQGRLAVRGIVGTPESSDYKTVFCNRVRFNSMISMN